MHRVISFAVATLVLTACVNLAPGQTVPPINVPSMPPINIPSMPPINFPSIPPFNIPSGLIPGGTGTCALITPAEVGSIFGGTPAFTDDSSGGCTFTLGDMRTFSVSIEQGTDIQQTRFLFGDTVRDITVGGLPALTGALLGGFPSVYVQKGSDALQITGFMANDEQTMAQLVQVATIAVSRWP